MYNLIEGYTKHSQTKIEFVQTTGQAVMHASRWLKIARSNTACKRVDGFVASLVSHWFSELETSDRILAGTLVEFCDVINIFEVFLREGVLNNFNFLLHFLYLQLTNGHRATFDALKFLLLLKIFSSLDSCSFLSEGGTQVNLFTTSAEHARTVRVDYLLNLQAADPMDISSNPFTALYPASSCALLGVLCGLQINGIE